MDGILVGIILAGAFVFTVKSFIKIYKGETSCSCGECSCTAKDISSCKTFQPLNKHNSKYG